MKTTLTVEIDYDPDITDPEGLATAMDRLLETVLSTPGIMEEYGDPRIGEFFVAGDKDNGNLARRWVLYDPDQDRLLTTQVYDSYEDAAEVAAQANDVLVVPVVWQEIHL